MNPSTPPHRSRLVSIVTPCFNEEVNVRPLHLKVREVFGQLEQTHPGSYRFEHLFIDNASRDQTPTVLRALSQEFSNVKVILNSRNFGHIRSPFYGLLQAEGDAVISLVADFQDPPELITDFLKKWEEGYSVVKAVKQGASEPPLMFQIRKLYYDLITRLSDIQLTKNFTGFGLYDQKIIQTLRQINDPYPYFRGLLAEIGFPTTEIPYHQPRRRAGITKNNFYTLYDLAMLGITNHSKVPLRIATMAGFFMAGLSLVVALGYLIAKVIFWDTFTVGTAPVLIGLFFFSSVQLFFIGIIGEYIGAIHTQVQKRPLVIEKERIGFTSELLGRTNRTS